MGSSSNAARGANRRFFKGLARAFGGAVVFSLPLLMTMEMWQMGFYMDRLRLALFMILMIPLLIGIDHYAGFESTSTWTEDVIDGMVAYGVAFVASATILFLLNVVNAGMPLREVLGKISLQAVPASFGAVLASSQLGGSGEGAGEQERKERGGYGTEVFLMIAGAVFLAFNVAPTEEMILIAFKATKWHVIALAAASLALAHAFVYAVDFKGQHKIPEGTPWWSIFLRYTVVAYAVSLLVSAYVLWTFGRYEYGTYSMYVTMAIVLGFPASIGAAASRLLL